MCLSQPLFVNGATSATVRKLLDQIRDTRMTTNSLINRAGPLILPCSESGRLPPKLLVAEMRTLG